MYFLLGCMAYCSHDEAWHHPPHLLLPACCCLCVQVPFDATEQDLWPFFSQIGNILELVVLRTGPGGKSRGCAFVTYQDRMLAEKAIRQLDGQVVLPNDPRGKPLIVKFANVSAGGQQQQGVMGVQQVMVPNMGMGPNMGMMAGPGMVMMAPGMMGPGSLGMQM